MQLSELRRFVTVNRFKELNIGCDNKRNVPVLYRKFFDVVVFLIIFLKIVILMMLQYIMFADYI